MSTNIPIGSLVDNTVDFEEFKTPSKEVFEKNNKFYVEFPKKLTKGGYPLRTECKQVLKKYFMKHYSEYYQICKNGDFIEDGTKSGYRTNGLYMIRKYPDGEIEIEELGDYPDSYGTVQEYFLGLRDFVPGYHDNEKFINMDPRCKSSWHHYFFPVDITYLRRQKIYPFDFTPYLFFSSFEYQGFNILVIYPFSYSFRPEKTVEYFYIVDESFDESYGFQEYVPTIMDGADGEVVFDDCVKNDAFKYIHELGKKYDVIMAPINLKEKDFPKINYTDSDLEDEEEVNEA